MKNTITIAVVLCAATAFAQGAGGMDMTKMGPMSRKPKNEAATKKEIMDFFKKMETAHDMDSMTAMNDFPVFMVTDDQNGNVEAREFSKDDYIAEMKPFYENMPKDMKTTHKPTITVLSDSLANVTDDFTMTMGKQKMTGKNAGLLIKKDGKWMWKSMVEAGWGGMHNMGAQGGAMGASGSMGATGSMGSTGMKGSTGAMGATGSTGMKH